MKISIKLFTSDKPTKKGYPVKLIISHNGHTERISLGIYYDKEQWDFNNELPFRKASMYDVVYPLIMNYRIKANKLMVEGVDDIERVKMELLARNNNIVSLYAFGKKIVVEKRGKGSDAYADLILSILEITRKYDADITLNAITYNWVMQFRLYNERRGLSNASVHNYIRTLKTIYNEAVRRGVITDKQPFKNTLNGLYVRSNRMRKKFIKIDDVKKLENIDLTGMQEVARDMWLLQFYFGGQDLKDIYYLAKNNIVNNRVYISRYKLSGKGYEFDLFVPDKAVKIINKYANSGLYVFDFEKTHTYYTQFIRRYRRALKSVQKKLNIQVLPKGGHLSVKVARHTFATRGKLLYIEEDLLRELMGHERADIDNYYKDRYPQAIRDAAQLRIIS